MPFYDLEKFERIKLVDKINQQILSELISKKINLFLLIILMKIPTSVKQYLSIGKIYKENKKLQKAILVLLDTLFKSENEKVRQTTINAAGEIGKIDFSPIEIFMKNALFDQHHSVRNAVIGSIKKMGKKNPKPVLLFAKQYMHHEDKEIRREICHGIELRGRTHPQDILPLLKELQFDKTARVRNTLVHVIGQIA